MSDKIYAIGLAQPQQHPVLDTEFVDGVYCVVEPEEAGKEEEWKKES